MPIFGILWTLNDAVSDGLVWESGKAFFTGNTLCRCLGTRNGERLCIAVTSWLARRLAVALCRCIGMYLCTCGRYHRYLCTALHSWETEFLSVSQRPPFRTELNQPECTATNRSARHCPVRIRPTRWKPPCSPQRILPKFYV